MKCQAVGNAISDIRSYNRLPHAREAKRFGTKD